MKAILLAGAMALAGGAADAATLKFTADYMGLPYELVVKVHSTGYDYWWRKNLDTYETFSADFNEYGPIVWSASYNGMVEKGSLAPEWGSSLSFWEAPPGYSPDAWAYEFWVGDLFYFTGDADRRLTNGRNVDLSMDVGMFMPGFGLPIIGEYLDGNLTITAVPLPAAAPLLAAGLAALGVAKRRKRKSQGV